MELESIRTKHLVDPNVVFALHLPQIGGPYGSKYNRLEFYEIYDTSRQSNTLLSTTWYF